MPKVSRILFNMLRLGLASPRSIFVSVLIPIPASSANWRWVFVGVVKMSLYLPVKFT